MNSDGSPRAKLALEVGTAPSADRKGANRFHVHVTTDATGNFRTAPLFPGKYAVRLNGARENLGEVEVKAKETTRFDRDG
jgi:hypothetical protein